jgi:hypothetical protein
MDADCYAIACNHAGSRHISPGARCYLIEVSSAVPSIRVLARSRGGRWVDTWVRSKHLGGFRVKTIPPSHPLYGDERVTYAPELRELLDRHLEHALAWQAEVRE